MLRRKLLEEVATLKDKHHVDKKMIKKFTRRVNSPSPLTEEVNIEDHICVFFVPVNKAAKLIYIGHHIKADDWIPPGGHIKINELPLDTVKREFSEELKHQLTNEPIVLFDLSIKDVSPNPRHPCKLHYDFWYLVYTDVKNFNVDRGEFYQAGWFSLDEALKKMKLRQYNQIVQKLKNFLK